MSKEITQEDKDYLWSLMPTWVKKVPSENHSWDPTYFGTLSRDGDLTVHNKVIQLLNQKKMSEEFCQHNGKYTLNKDNKCCKCKLPLKKSIKGIRLPIKPKQR